MAKKDKDQEEDNKVVPENLPKVRGNTFLINHDFGDWFANVQHGGRRLGDIGPESEKYKDKAFHQLAKEQENFKAPETYGTVGRPDNKNYNRMEYDKVVRHDKKDHESVMKEVMAKQEIDVKKLLKALQPKDDLYTVNSTETVVSDKPIV